DANGGQLNPDELHLADLAERRWRGCVRRESLARDQDRQLLQDSERRVERQLWQPAVDPMCRGLKHSRERLAGGNRAPKASGAVLAGEVPYTSRHLASCFLRHALQL